jgi:hypothetical protein
MIARNDKLISLTALETKRLGLGRIVEALQLNLRASNRKQETLKSKTRLSYSLLSVIPSKMVHF